MSKVNHVHVSIIIAIFTHRQNSLGNTLRMFVKTLYIPDTVIFARPAVHTKQWEIHTLRIFLALTALSRSQSFVLNVKYC